MPRRSSRSQLAQKKEKIILKKFNMNNITYDKIVMMIGKRKSGKSWMVRDLMYHARKVPSAVVVSGTERVNKFFSNHVPEMFIHDEWSSDLAQRVLDKQNKACDRCFERGKLKKDGSPDLTGQETMLLYDDLAFEAKKWVRDRTTKEICMNGRHFGILFIMTLQYALDIPPNIRTNCDYVFLFKENNHATRRKLWEHYAGVVPDYNLFCEIFDEVTKDHGCMVIDNTQIDGDLSKCIYWYKADDRRDFKIGSSKYWSIQEKAKRYDLANHGAKHKHNSSNDHDNDEQPVSAKKVWLAM